MLEVKDISVENSITINGKTVNAETIRRVPVRFPEIFSGDAWSIWVPGNAKIERYIGGSNKTNTSYYYFKIPEDFVSFPTNAFGIDTRRTGSNPDLRVTMYKNGVVDSTIDDISLKATAINDTWENKRATPGSTYAVGDDVIIKIVTTTGVGAGNFNAIGSIDIKYLGK